MMTFSRLIALLLAVTSVCIVVQSAPAQADEDTAAEALIEQLGHPDPKRRQEAAEALKEMGSAAREALLRASKADDPQISPQAAQILLQLPWHKPTDPPEVQTLLRNYGRREEVEKRMLLDRMSQLRDSAGTAALLRLIEQEPSSEIRWTICELLTRGLNDEKIKQAIRNVEINENASPPMLVLQARARLLDNTPAALGLLRRAIDQQHDQPLTAAMQSGPLEWAFEVLVHHALATNDLQSASDLYRQQAQRQLLAGALEPRALYDLFALHAQYGAAPGFAQDLETFQPHLGKPQLLYALSKLYQRQGQHLLATALAHAAAAASPPSQQSRLLICDFLISHGWYDLAEREYQIVLSLDGEHKPYADYTALLRLSYIAGERGNELLAAEYLKRIPDALARPRIMLQVSGELAGLIEWRLFRAARDAGDREKTREHADRLLTYEAAYLDIATDLVPYLKEHGRLDEAKAVFDRAYSQQRMQVDAHPISAEKLNNLAWLCARCDERLEEALDLATRAITILPDHYAYLDTAAEAHFRIGNAARAVELEERALHLRPNDRFMLQQLQRFRAGLSAGEE